MPLPSTCFDPARPPSSTDVERALALLRRAVADCGYTLDVLGASMGKRVAYIDTVLRGEQPMSVDFFLALPPDVEARFEQLRSEHFGLLVLTAANGERG